MQTRKNKRNIRIKITRNIPAIFHFTLKKKKKKITRQASTGDARVKKYIYIVVGEELIVRKKGNRGRKERRTISLRVSFSEKEDIETYSAKIYLTLPLFTRWSSLKAAPRRLKDFPSLSFLFCRSNPKESLPFLSMRLQEEG